MGHLFTLVCDLINIFIVIILVIIKIANIY